MTVLWLYIIRSDIFSCSLANWLILLAKGMTVPSIYITFKRIRIYFTQGDFQRGVEIALPFQLKVATIANRPLSSRFGHNLNSKFYRGTCFRHSYLTNSIRLHKSSTQKNIGSFLHSKDVVVRRLVDLAIVDWTMPHESEAQVVTLLCGLPLDVLAP